MAFVIVENLRGFFNSRPPLVVFMICLASFAIALITFAYIVKTKDMPNPDITEDWNSLLQKFSKLEFCMNQTSLHHNGSTSGTRVVDLTPGEATDLIANKMQGKSSNDDDDNDSENESSRSAMSKREAPVKAASPTYEVPQGSSGRVESTGGQEDTPTSRPTTVSSKKENIVNITFHLNVDIESSPELQEMALSSMHFIASVPGGMLGMKGKLKTKTLQVSMSFPQNLSMDNCLEKLGKKVCKKHYLPACITFSGPADMLPRHIGSSETDTCPGDLDLTEGSYRNMSVAISEYYGRDFCPNGGHVKTEYLFDDSLTILLSEDERSRINLHLMRTSYFLFVMVVTLFCYAMVKGRPGKVKTVVHIPYDKLATQP